MARFKVMDAEILTIPDSARANAGNQYVQVTLKNADNFWSENTRKQNFFSENIVNAFKKYISQDKGGDAEQDLKLPEEMAIMHGTFEVVQYDKPFYRRYMSDLVDGAGVEHHRGDYITDANGNRRLYNSLEVFCQQYLDPDSNTYVYEQGKNKLTLATQTFNSSCEYATTETAKDDGQDVEETAEQQAGNVAPINNNNQQQHQQQQPNNNQNNGYHRR